MSLSDDERERAYSPSSCVGGDIEPFLTEYAAASEAARRWCHDAGISVRTIAYARSPTQSIDIVTPDVDDAPIVVFFHGGYWQELSRRESFSPAPGFLSRGIAYAAVDYTLAPAANLDQIVAECRKALTTIRDEASELNIDAERMIVAGSSAGAHLAAMVALDPDGGPKPAGMILLSGIYELAPLIGTTINEALGLDWATAARNSPARLPLDDPPPAVIAYGENETDQFKKQSRLFAQALVATGSKTVELEIAGRNHFDLLTDVGPSTSDLGRAINQLIDSTGSADANL
ncbi:MAG: alpha/beta hydrolase [Acidimicrobiales bacterium]